MYPRFDIMEVNLVLEADSTVVSTKGNTPLFKSKKFEEAVKKMLHSELESLRT